MKKAGRKSKYHSHVEPRLFEIECWARNGLIEEQIAKNLGVAYSTFKDYKNKFSAFSAALKKGKEIVDFEVENALLKRALGYKFTERKSAPVEMKGEEFHAIRTLAVNRYKLEHPEATIEEIKAFELGISKYKMVVVEEKVKEIAPDVTAQIFWLKNRRPDKWRDKQEVEHSGETTHNIRSEPDLSNLSVEELKELEAILSKTTDTK
jgi:hypothetical protein